ncbi:MAG: hypothetical protein IJN61_01310 [Clostridia bacterium]|nr:hypothetical protein [Clostridia bacterium]
MARRRKTPLDVCAELGIVTAEIDIRGDEGFCFVYNGQPFAFTKTGWPNTKRDTALRVMIAQLLLGYVGAWGDDFVYDARNTPDSIQATQIRETIVDMFGEM